MSGLPGMERFQETPFDTIRRLEALVIEQAKRIAELERRRSPFHNLPPEAENRMREWAIGVGISDREHVEHDQCRYAGRLLFGEIDELREKIRDDEGAWREANADNDRFVK